MMLFGGLLVLVVACDASVTRIPLIRAESSGVSIPLANVSYQYVGRITLGNPPQEFRVAFESATSNFWVPSVRCESDFCTSRQRYDSSKSSTYIANGTKIVIPPGILLFCSMNGILSNDDLCFGELCIKSQQFTEFTDSRDASREIISDSDEEEPYDGIMGLGFKKMAAKHVTPPWYNMMSQGLVQKKIFSIYMNSSLKAKIGGELTFGGSNPDHYSGDFTYAPVLGDTRWKVALDGVTLGTKKFCTEGCKAIMSTSSPLFRLSYPVAAAINEAIPGAQEGMPGVYFVDCSEKSLKTMPTLELTIGGHALRMTPSEYTVHFGEGLCLSGFQGADMKPGEWMFGSNFFGRFYTQFDYENMRLGFAYVK